MCIIGPISEDHAWGLLCEVADIYLGSEDDALMDKEGEFYEMFCSLYDRLGKEKLLLVVESMMSIRDEWGGKVEGDNRGKGKLQDQDVRSEKGEGETP